MRVSRILSPGGGGHVAGWDAGWGGHAWQGACMAGGVGHAWQGVCVWYGGVHGKGHAWRGACMAGKTAIAVGSTHPSGMHSC